MASAVVASATYTADTTRYEWLVNDWDTDSNLWVNVQGTYTVSLQPQGFYGVQLRQVAESLDGNLKSIAVLPSAGGAELEQVSSLVAPGAGQYRMSPLPTGRLEFSSASNGTEYVIKYVSSGNVNSQTVIDAIASDIDSISGSLAIDAGTITRSGVSVYGYLSDGTPVYAKTLTATITNGNSTVDVAHSISSAYTSDRILHVVGHIDNTAKKQFYYTGSGSGAANDTPILFEFDNTNVTVTRFGTTGSSVIQVFIVYK